MYQPGRTIIMLATLAATGAAEASTNGQTISGTVLDGRIERCGIEVGGTGAAVFRPFIETSARLSGSYSLRLAKRSDSGSSVIRQANRFADGSLGGATLVVERPAQVVLEMSVADADGRPLCELRAELDL